MRKKMNQFEIIFSEQEWKEQIDKLVKSGKDGKRLRFSSAFDYVFSFKLQKAGLNCWFKSR
jgi:hypothetical protein